MPDSLIEQIPLFRHDCAASWHERAVGMGKCDCMRFDVGIEKTLPVAPVSAVTTSRIRSRDRMKSVTENGWG